MAARLEEAVRRWVRDIVPVCRRRWHNSMPSKGTGQCIEDVLWLDEFALPPPVELPASPTVLEIEDLCVSVKKGGAEDKTVDILKGVSAAVERGQVLSVIGASGSGKTTLLNAIAADLPNYEVKGRITLDRHVLNHDLFRCVGAYVWQDDQLWPGLTVRESLQFAAVLYQHTRSVPQLVQLIDELLKLTGLASCQDVFVGDGFLLKGISSGQQRRLSVAVELLKCPFVLILDEPTSGLDSVAAEAIVDLLNSVAHANNAAVIYTIHQPSSYLFRCFDHLLVLAGGRTCYFGDASNAVSHFEQLGFTHEPGVNPAEFLLRLTNTDFCCKKQVEAIADAWSSSYIHRARKHASAAKPQHAFFEMQLTGHAWLSKILYLSLRLAVINMRNPVAYVGRILCTSFFILLVSVAYIGARGRNQDEVLSRVWAVVWMHMLPSFLCIGAVPTFCSEASCLKKEMKNGLCNPKCYFCASVLVSLPFWFLLGISSLVPAFLILDLNWAHFHKILTISVVYIGFSDSVAQLCGTYFATAAMGSMVFLQQSLLNMIFNGTLLPKVDKVIWPLRALFYVMPSKYVFRTAILLEFQNLSFDGFQRCLDPLVPLSAKMGLPCWGEAGSDIVVALRRGLFPVLSTKDTFAADVGLIIAQLLLVKLLYLASLDASLLSTWRHCSLPCCCGRRGKAKNVSKRKLSSGLGVMLLSD